MELANQIYRLERECMTVLAVWHARMDEITQDYEIINCKEDRPDCPMTDKAAIAWFLMAAFSPHHIADGLFSACARTSLRNRKYKGWWDVVQFCRDYRELRDSDEDK